MNRHPLWPAFKDVNGVGRKQAARLLSAIGDPAWHTLEERPRTFNELISYCGLAPQNGKARSRHRGERANWNSTARKRLWLVAGSAIKEPGRRWPMDGEAGWELRRIYETGRDKYATAVHVGSCNQCGPAGKPAQPGSPLNPGHQKARAVRLVMRQILEIAYEAAQKVHTDA